jgi:hypothetical protein
MTEKFISFSGLIGCKVVVRINQNVLKWPMNTSWLRGFLCPLTYGWQVESIRVWSVLGYQWWQSPQSAQTVMLCQGSLCYWTWYDRKYDFYPMSYDNLSSVSQNVLKFYHQLTGDERRIPFIFNDFHFCRSRVIGLDMTENRIFTLCRMITWVVQKLTGRKFSTESGPKP